jgi:hypothetical protein
MLDYAVWLLCVAGVVAGDGSPQAGWQAMGQHQMLIDWWAYHKRQSYSGAWVAPAMQWAVPPGAIYGPSFVSPSMQWAVPNQMLGGPPLALPYEPPGYPRY